MTTKTPGTVPGDQGGEPRRCIVTGNPCGTDTRPRYDPCLCSGCRAYYDARLSATLHPPATQGAAVAGPALPESVARVHRLLDEHRKTLGDLPADPMLALVDPTAYDRAASTPPPPASEPPLPAWLKDGEPVWYSPDSLRKAQYLGVVDGDPRKCGDTWVVGLSNMEASYHGGRGRVPAAALEALEPAGAATAAKAALEVQLRESRQARDNLAFNYGTLVAERDALVAQMVTMRAAMTEVKEQAMHMMDCRGGGKCAGHCPVGIARAALAASGKEG